jgi:hypothetical protein
MTRLTKWFSLIFVANSSVEGSMAELRGRMVNLSNNKEYAAVLTRDSDSTQLTTAAGVASFDAGPVTIQDALYIRDPLQSNLPVAMAL